MIQNPQHCVTTANPRADGRLHRRSTFQETHASFRHSRLGSLQTKTRISARGSRIERVPGEKTKILCLRTSLTCSLLKKYNSLPQRAAPMSFLCHSARMSSPAPFESVGGDPLQFEMVHQNHCFGDSRSDAFHVGGLRTCSLPIVFFLGFLIALTFPSALFAADLFPTQVAPILNVAASVVTTADRRGDFSLQTANDLADSGFVVRQA